MRDVDAVQAHDPAIARVGVARERDCRGACLCDCAGAGRNDAERKPEGGAVEPREEDDTVPRDGGVVARRVGRSREAGRDVRERVAGHGDVRALVAVDEEDPAVAGVHRAAESDGGRPRRL